MKNLYLIALFIVPFFASCGDDNNVSEDIESNEIKLKVSLVEAFDSNSSLKSVITDDFPIGVYAYNNVSGWLAGASNSSTPNSPNIINNDAATVSAEAGNFVEFATGPYYYPSGGDLVNFFAYAPHGTESTAAGTGTSPVVTIAVDGQTDVLYATGTGRKQGSAAAVQPVLNFNHKLTQLQFTFKSGTGYPASGNSVVSLTVKNQPTSVLLNVGAGTTTSAGSAGIQALSSANQTAGIAIVTAGTNANSPVITYPASGSTAYLLDIVVKPAGGGSNVTYLSVPVNLTAVAGSSHMITLSFNGTSIVPSATVADWVVGTGVTTPVE